MGLQQLRSPLADTLMQGLSLMGSEAVAVLLPVMLVALGFARRYGAAASLVLVVGGAQLLNNVLKDVFERTRPAPVASFIPAQQFSFPSGHAMVAAAFYVFLAYLGWRLLRGRWRYLFAGTLLLLVLLIGISRLYLQAHYFTDVVAGYVAGFLWTDAVILGGRFLRRPRAIEDERPPPLAPARAGEGGAATTPGG
jgi:undecaprenyl-diphosphatase